MSAVPPTDVLTVIRITKLKSSSSSIGGIFLTELTTESVTSTTSSTNTQETSGPAKLYAIVVDSRRLRYWQPDVNQRPISERHWERRGNREEVLY
ncbi:hypothetical protein DL767_011275 [Monosporascus sp. MG133]|nr:hypothetical protein DL767_011275 [Monosporascus sp. MG133]